MPDSPCTGDFTTPASTAALVPEPVAARRRRRRTAGQKPAGSRWLNYLLGLGCLASLFPLWWEYTHGQHSDVLPQPHRDDPWVRVIDAVEEGQRSEAAASQSQRKWRHHPRHNKNKTQVSASVNADGGVEDRDDTDEDILAQAAPLSSWDHRGDDTSTRPEAVQRRPGVAPSSSSQLPGVHAPFAQAVEARKVASRSSILQAGQNTTDLALDEAVHTASRRGMVGAAAAQSTDEAVDEEVM